MHFKRLPGLEGKTREESLARNLGDPIGRLLKKKKRELENRHWEHITNELA